MQTYQTTEVQVLGVRGVEVLGSSGVGDGGFLSKGTTDSEMGQEKAQTTDVQEGRATPSE
jgi:hypothetical protein